MWVNPAQLLVNVGDILVNNALPSDPMATLTDPGVANAIKAVAMKHPVSVLFVAALAAASASAPARAGEASAAMPVSLSVSEGCSIAATPMEFAMASASGASARSQATVALACSPHTTYEIAIDRGDNPRGGKRRMANSKTGSTIAYEVYRDAARTLRWGDNFGSDTVGGRVEGGGPVVHIAYGEVAPGERIAAGAYADTLVVTVSF